MSNLLDDISEQESEVLAVEESVEDLARRQRAKDRSGIAWVIVWAFVIALALIFVLVLGNLFMADNCKGSENCTKWQEPAKFLHGIVSSVLVPIVTLVLGYYFGKEKVE